MRIKKAKYLDYIVRYPNGYEKGKKYPVIIFLHGAGTRMKPLSALKRNNFFKITDEYEDFPFVCVAPMCHSHSWFDLSESLKDFALEILNQEYTDTERLYVMGNSMGGYATWQLAMMIPEHVAAIVPICGGGIYAFASRLKNVPVWAFHGQLDHTVLVEESVKMVNAVNKREGNAKLTVYPENGHNSWDDTFKNPEVFSWLLSHKNNNAEALTDAYNDSKTYG